MSNSKQKHEGNGSSRARMQTSIQATNEEDEQKQTDAHVFPAMRLYRHALESIFGMVDLQDLIHILAVSREWSAAVRSMAPIHGTLQRHDWRSPGLPRIAHIVGSPLLRHLAAMHVEEISFTPLDNASLALLAQHATNLTSLRCELILTPNQPFLLPSKLTSLQLQLDDGYSNPEINGVLTVLAALPLLSHLRLCMKTLELPSSDVDLGLLGSSPSITDLTLETPNGGTPMLSDTHVEQIRSPLGALQRFYAVWRDPDELARFLQPPVTARWRDIGRVEADARTGELLLTLPALTKLELSDKEDTAYVEFLPQLPQLKTLLLCSYKWGRGGWYVPADAVLASLVLCDGLTDLDLRCGFNSAHWSALFAKLRNLKKLTIRQGDMETLECFAAGPITHSLEVLSLYDFALPPSEIIHLYGLRRLRTLRLSCCFPSRLADATVDSLSPPTRLLPALTELFYLWTSAAGQQDSRVRKSQSMQERWPQWRSSAQ